MPRRKSLPHLHQARNEMQQAIEGLENTAEALPLSMAGNQSSESSPVRRWDLDAIATRLVNAPAGQAQVEQVIE